LNGKAALQKAHENVVLEGKDEYRFES